MPFSKIGPGQYVSPSGRKFNDAQVRLYYARGGNFPGQAGMREQLGPSLIRSPTAPGKAKSPTFKPSGKTNAAKSPVPTSILAGTKQTFGPLAYRRQEDQEFPNRDLYEKARNQRVPKRKR